MYYHNKVKANMNPDLIHKNIILYYEINYYNIIITN